MEDKTALDDTKNVIVLQWDITLQSYILKNINKIKAICVVEAFHAYVEKTKMLRGGYSQLFIGLQKPHTPVIE